MRRISNQSVAIDASCFLARKKNAAAHRRAAACSMNRCSSLGLVLGRAFVAVVNRAAVRRRLRLAYDLSGQKLVERFGHVVDGLVALLAARIVIDRALIGDVAGLVDDEHVGSALRLIRMSNLAVFIR